MAYCNACHAECDVHNVDFGIGSYEFWGSCNVDVNIQTVSKCCDADAFENVDTDDDGDPVYTNRVELNEWSDYDDE